MVIKIMICYGNVKFVTVMMIIGFKGEWLKVQKYKM